MSELLKPLLKYILKSILKVLVVIIIMVMLIMFILTCTSYFAPDDGVPGVFDQNLRIIDIDDIDDIDNIDNLDISGKIELVSRILEKTSSELSNIQKQLEGRIEYVENLKKEAEIAENVISLSEEQANAIQAKLNQELKASSNKSLFQSIAINAFFFVLGYIIHPILKTIKKWGNKKSQNDSSTFYNNKYTDDEIAQAIMLLDTIKQKEYSIKD